MYKLVVVDDEKAIRKGICKYIDWESMGFEVVADFEDGKETIDYIKNNEVDVVLTDIEMAEVSGLELARYIHENNLLLKTVIISGYKEFEYARKAVEYGVEHYLLKPVRLEEVSQVFAKIKNELDERKAIGDQFLTEQKNFEEILPELREQFWISLLVRGFRSREKIIKRKEFLRLDIDVDKPCAILDVKWKNREEVEDYLLHYYNENCHNLINNIFGGVAEDIHSFPVYLSADILKIIVTTARKESLEEFRKRLEMQIEEKCQSAFNLLKLKFEIKIEKMFENMMEMTTYNCVLSESDKHEQTGKTNIPANPFTNADYERLIQKYKLLMGIINDGDFEELDNLVDTIFYEFRKLPLDQVKHLLIDMFSMLSGKFIKMGIDFWKNMNEKVSYQEIMDATSREELKAKCKSMLEDAISIVRSRQNISSRSFIEQAVAYIKEHYSEDITLEIIADKFFLNQTYFSRLFKQYTGTTFKDYLIELRMEKAKELLSLGKYKVYEVSQMVGYRSEKYFFRIFKEYAGCSPAEYCRSRNISDGNN